MAIAAPLPASSQAITTAPQTTQDLHTVFEEIVQAFLNEATLHFEEKSGGKIKLGDKLKLGMAQKIFDLSKKFNSEAKFAKMVEASNKIIPVVVDYVDEEKIIAKLPPHLKDNAAISLFEKAGATEMAGLLRQYTPQGSVAAIVPGTAPA